MGKSCVIYPTIKVGNKEVESKLFKDLQSFTGNREVTKYIWGLTRVPEFTSISDTLKKDENGEPVIEDLVKELNLKELLEGKFSLTIAKRDLGATDKNDNPILHKSISKIMDKVIDYNINNPDQVANIIKVDGGYNITLDFKDINNSEVPNRLMFNNALNNQLLGILNRLGFNVKVDDKLTYDGIFDPTNVEYTVDGLRTVIRIAKGEQGEEAFPEEFSHLIISGLLTNPLVDRLLNQLNDEVIREVLGDSYDTYNNKYKGDMNLLKQEAAAKLLQYHIVNPDKPSTSIISRIWNWAKRKFSLISEKTINDAYNRANEGFAKLASQVMDESIIPSISTDLIMSSRPLYKLGESTTDMEKLANDALEKASRRLKILQSRSRNKKYNEQDIKSIKNLQDLIEKKKYAKSCSAFLTDTLSQIEIAQSKLNKLLDKDTRSDSDLGKLNRISAVLRNIKEFSDGYEPIIKQMMAISSMQKDGSVDLSEEDASNISDKATQVFKLINDLNSKYKKLRFDAVYNFLKIYWGKDKIISAGKNKNQEITLRMILEMADKDINGIDRWISSLSDASDPLLSLIDKVVKVSKAKRDRQLEDIIASIREEHNKLKNAGYDTSFMFERNKDGKLTGRLISDYDFERFNREKKELIDKLYKEGYKSYQVRDKIESWERRHTKQVKVAEILDEETGESIPLYETVPIYSKDIISNLSTEQREYYDNMIQAKALLESQLPNKRYSNVFNAVQISSDMITAISNSTSPKDAAKTVLSKMKDDFIRREDDTEFGDTQEVLLDFSGNPVDKLPIYYTTPLKNTNRLSTDFTSSMMAYAGMTINYVEMNKVVDALELTRDLVKDREVQQYSGDKKLEEAFTVIHKKFNKSYTKPGSGSNIGDRLDDYFDSAVYNKMKKDQGSFKMFGHEVDKAKTIDNMKAYTGAVGLGLNTFSAISNVTAGNIQMFIDAVGGEYFNLKNLAIAKKNYYALLPEYLAEINSTTKTSKLGLLIDKFDALEDFFEELKAQGKFTGPMARILGEANIFFLNSAGEHYLHAIPMLAMLDAFKVNYNGKEISLFDAFEVSKSTDDKGNVLSASLQIKDGVTTLEDKEVSEDDLLNLKLKIGKVNQSLNGAFNDLDKGAIHRGALGRMAMQFRQWMPAHYNRRFAGAYYDAQMDQWREGYYRTMGRFALDLMKDLARMKFELATHWDSLNEHEKANIKRALAEISIFAELSALISLMGPVKDKKGQWLDRMIIYNLKRMKLEVGASMPSHEFLDNMMTMLQSPSASIKTIDNILDLLQFQNMFVELQSGRYKGWTEYQRDLIEVLPIYPKIQSVVDIAEDDYMFKIFEH